MKADSKITSGAQAATITVLISPVIEREFKRRDVFPELRIENAARIQNGATGLHDVSIAVANALLADAKAMQAHGRELSRGIPKAYSALVRNIGSTLKEEARRGLWDDPGRDEMERRAAQTVAWFKVGEVALYFSEGREPDCIPVTVVKAYGMYKVFSEDGAFITAEAQRIDYQNGYVVSCRYSEHTFFATAYKLTRDDCKPAHLCLVR